MQAVYTEPVKTPMTFQEAHDCMVWALKTRLGSDPTDEVLALALAKTALETGRWSSIWNGNWGNVKAADTYEGMYTCITLNEVLVRGGKRVTVWFAPEGELSASPSKGGQLIAAPMAVPPGHPQTRMRAFANNFDGVDCYVDFVANGRYKKAWAALLTGNALSYVHELKVAGYFTADESEYVKGVAALQHEFLGRIRSLPDVPKADIEWERLKANVPNLQFLAIDVMEHLRDRDREDAPPADKDKPIA
jgi:hypothetical protein